VIADSIFDHEVGGNHLQDAEIWLQGGQALRPLVLKKRLKDELRTMVEGFTIKYLHVGVMNGGDWQRVKTGLASEGMVGICSYEQSNSHFASLQPQGGNQPSRFGNDPASHL
jgi:hypothetical protein